MKEMKTTTLLNHLDEVLRFSSEMIMRSLRKEKPEDLSIVRKSCEELSKAGIYPFDMNSNDQSLRNQIQEFATHVNG